MASHYPNQAVAKKGEAGYNLVVLIVAVTLLNIAVAAVLPLWSTAIRREKEEELVFRGWQYAEAIRVYRLRHNGNYPVKLEQLLEEKPRSIRQLWKDPMTEDGKWALIFQNQQQGVQPKPPGRRGGQRPPAGEEGGQSTENEGNVDEDGRPQFGPRKGDVVEVGPIIGVHSKSQEESLLVFFGHERYDEWHFREDLLPAGQRGSIEGNPAVGHPGQEFSMDFSTRWLGRPWRFQNQAPQPQDGTMPDGGTPNKPPPRRSPKP